MLLERLGIHNVQDLLLHLPNRYQNRAQLHPLAESRGNKVTVEVTVVSTAVVSRHRRILHCLTQAETGKLTLKFFHHSEAQRRSLSPGKILRCFGEIQRDSRGLVMIHPEYDFVRGDDDDGRQYLTTLYPLTQGLSQARLRGLVGQGLDLLDTRIPDPADEFFASEGLPFLSEALMDLHRPPVDTDLLPVRRRLAWEELVAHQLCMLKLRSHQRQAGQSLKLILPSDALEDFTRGLPFALTSAQKRVTEEILADLSNTKPMLRLLQGDVGSGKTLVVAIATLAAIRSNAQAAIMVPTDILARQHVRTLLTLGLPTELLVGQMTRRQRRSVSARLIMGENIIVVGTHALFQSEVSFTRLALVIIDEQHRFGVHQRLSFYEQGSRTGSSPHRLVMTATPIPRTLAMSLYSDLDCSVLDERPPGKARIKTITIPGERGEELVREIGRVCRHENRQVYWVCPLIEPSDMLEAAAAQEAFRRLTQAVPDVSVGLVHGRMKGPEKEQVINDFAAGHLRILVATTVIEVGIDVANATIMVIENAERLGLAQLHQLRGRVGRGLDESHCVLMYQKPLSGTARQRLRAMRETLDGFRIAEQDLQLRGSGELFGPRQAGIPVFRVADLMAESAYLPKVHQIATRIQGQDPQLATSLMDRWLPNARRLVEA